jgi:hypothetical protein
MQREQASATNADLLEANTTQCEVLAMTTITLPSTDPRGAKAVAIATDAGQWLKCRTRDGRKAYGIRSSRDANVVYFTTRRDCTCFDARRHECKHMLAVRLHCELVAEQRAAVAAAASWTRPQRGVIPAALIERED